MTEERLRELEKDPPVPYGVIRELCKAIRSAQAEGAQHRNARDIFARDADAQQLRADRAERQARELAGKVHALRADLAARRVPQVGDTVEVWTCPEGWVAARVKNCTLTTSNSFDYSLGHWRFPQSEAAPKPSSDPDGVWRCQNCGDMADLGNSRFRWNGESWEHQCGHPQAGCNLCSYFGPKPQETPIPTGGCPTTTEAPANAPVAPESHCYGI